MPGATYTSEAENDLRRIAEYIARDNLLAALTWLDETRTRCDLLATQPAVGQQVKTARYGELKRHVMGNYLIYYHPAADGVHVVRVVHGAREQESLI